MSDTETTAAPAQAARTVTIVNRWDSSRVLFRFDVPADIASGMETRAALEAATRAGANLRSANLGGANLGGADLGGADLRGADLRGANLGGADLGGADLGGADLRGADLGGADLRGANLGGADLRGANLGGANLGGADLGGADLAPIRTDIFDILLRAPREVPALRAALAEGRVDGTVYEGSCACLVGTIANARGANYRELGAGIEPNSSRPAECFFLGIKRGDTPETNPVSRIALEWVDEFLALMTAAHATTPAARAELLEFMKGPEPDEPEARVAMTDALLARFDITPRVAA